MSSEHCMNTVHTMFGWMCRAVVVVTSGLPPARQRGGRKS